MTTALTASRGRLPDWLWGWACDECGANFRITDIIPADYAKGAAEKCCAFTCDKCKAPTPNHCAMCNSCAATEQSYREAERLQRAELVDWDGPVWADDQHYPDTFTAADEGHAGGRAWVCVPVPLQLDARSALDHAMKDHCEESWEDIEGHEEALQAALDKWAAPFSKLSWEPGKTATILPDAEGDE